MHTRVALVVVLLVILTIACGSSSTGLSPTNIPQPTPSPTFTDLTVAGDQALEAGNFSEAVRLYNLALDDDPQNEAAMIGLGRAFYYLAQYESARTALQDAMELAPRNTVALEMLGRTDLALYYYTYNSDLLQEAGEAFEQWSTLVADDPAPYAYLAWVAHAQGDAAAVSRRLVQAGVDTEHPVVLIVRGLQAEDREDYETVRELGLTAWELVADWPFPAFESIVCARFVGNSYAELGQYEEAIEWGLIELGLGPAIYNANNNVAWWYALNGQCDQAPGYIEQEITLYPENWRPYYVRAYCASEAGDQATAFAAYRQAVVRGMEDQNYWHLDLEGSTTKRGITVELTGIDLYGQQAKIYSTINNPNGQSVWVHQFLIEWPGGQETTYVDMDSIDLAAGLSNWTSTLTDVAISPGDWLRVTVKFQFLGMNIDWVDITVETMIPPLEPTEG